MDVTQNEPNFATFLREMSRGDAVSSISRFEEIIAAKAYWMYRKNRVRDFEEFAALARLVGIDVAVSSLMQANERFGHTQSVSVRLCVAQCLLDPRPSDHSVDEIAHRSKKSLVTQDWKDTVAICASIGEALTVRLFADSTP